MSLCAVDALRGELIATLPGHDNPILRVGVGPDGATVATLAGNGAVPFWRAPR